MPKIARPVVLAIFHNSLRTCLHRLRQHYLRGTLLGQASAPLPSRWRSPSSSSLASNLSEPLTYSIHLFRDRSSRVLLNLRSVAGSVASMSSIESATVAAAPTNYRNTTVCLKSGFAEISYAPFPNINNSPFPTHSPKSITFPRSRNRITHTQLEPHKSVSNCSQPNEIEGEEREREEDRRQEQGRMEQEKTHKRETEEKREERGRIEKKRETERLMNVLNQTCKSHESGVGRRKKHNSHLRNLAPDKRTQLIVSWLRRKRRRDRGTRRKTEKK